MGWIDFRLDWLSFSFYPNEVRQAEKDFRCQKLHFLRHSYCWICYNGSKLQHHMEERKRVKQRQWLELHSEVLESMLLGMLFGQLNQNRQWNLLAFSIALRVHVIKCKVNYIKYKWHICQYTLFDNLIDLKWFQWFFTIHLIFFFVASGHLLLTTFS